MASSGSINLAGASSNPQRSIEAELGVSGTISLRDANVLALAGKTGQSVTMPGDFYGKSNSVQLTVNFYSSVANAVVNFSSLGGYVAGKSIVTINVSYGAYLYGDTPINANITPFPAGLTITGATGGDSCIINNSGYIIGQGGYGSVSRFCCLPYYRGWTVDGTGGNGGPALSLGCYTTLNNYGYVAGGGGGGGGNDEYYINGGGGAGGAGGGCGSSSYWCRAHCCCGHCIPYGEYSCTPLGGGPGGLGQCATGQCSDTGSPPGLFIASTRWGGGAGGRQLPGIGGFGGIGPGAGGGAGGAGGSYLGQAGGSGGSGNSAGSAGSGPGYHFNSCCVWVGGGGGGGWGASGGNSGYFHTIYKNGPYAGGAPGNAIQLNGNTGSITGSGTIWGPIS